MEIVTRPKNGEKIIELIRRSAQDEIPIIVPTEWMGSLVEEWAEALKLEIPQPKSINKVVNQGGKPGKYLIDDLEGCLNQLGIDPVCVTVKTEEDSQ